MRSEIYIINPVFIETGLTGYIGRRCESYGRIMPGAVILGPSRIGKDTYIDDYVTIGYPARTKLKNIPVMTYDELDSMSDGAVIGDKCIVRRNSIIYENSYIDNEVELGHDVLIRSGTSIGERSRIGSGTQIDGDVKIGDDVSIQSFVYIPPKSRIGNKVFIGPMVCLTNDTFPPSSRLVGVVIEDEAIIGAGSILLPGIRIGKRAVIAAGSVVTSDVEDDCFVLGSPAKPYGSRIDYERKKRNYELG